MDLLIFIYQWIVKTHHVKQDIKAICKWIEQALQLIHYTCESKL